MMDKAIREFPQQFTFVPVVVNADALQRTTGAVVCGMGGSALTADLLTAWDPLWDPVRDLHVHRGYGLPALRDIDDRLIIASSYSGNTEETLDAYDAARTERNSLAVITTGGELLARAERDGVPYVRLPATGIQPRMAIGYSILALAALLRHERATAKLHALAALLDASALEERGRTRAEQLAGRTPLVYASDRNAAIARYWKIVCNETGKIPAFANVLPELNHNEMSGFDVGAGGKDLLGRFAVIMLGDTQDDPRIVRRTDALEAMLHERGVPVHREPFTGGERFERMFTAILTASWTAYYLAVRSGAEAEQVPMVEEFKRRIAAP